MIIPINFPSSSLATSQLPPQLAKLGHDEVVLVELQGRLEVSHNTPNARDGQFVGKLRVDVSGKPTLLIGFHFLEGKFVNLPKPVAVITRSPRQLQLASEDDILEGSSGNASAPPAWDMLAIVKRKIVFDKRPMPMSAASQAAAAALRKS